jgi:2-dehydro-3-deoxyglucarate aldolase
MPTTVRITGNRLPYAPKHLLTSSLAYTHSKGINVFVENVYTGRQFGDDLNTVGGTPEMAARYRALGYDFVGVASDLGLLMRSAQAALQALRNEAGAHVHTLQEGTRTEGGY